MVSIPGVDYSFDRPAPIILFALGYRWAGRYFGPGSGKLATAAECRAIHAAGLSIVALAEGFARDALKGHAEGVRQAQLADTGYFLAGGPNDRPIFFAVDFDMTVAQRPAVRAFLAGCADVIGLNRVGVYGGLRTVDWAYQNSYAKWYYQTAAWSQGLWAPHIHIQQYSNGHIIGNGLVDLDRAVRADFGQWPKPAAAPGAPGTGPAPIVTEGPWDFTPDMAGISSDLSLSASKVGGLSRVIDNLRR